jgi:hypothetical protein
LSIDISLITIIITIGIEIAMMKKKVADLMNLNMSISSRLQSLTKHNHQNNLLRRELLTLSEKSSKQNSTVMMMKNTMNNLKMTTVNLNKNQRKSKKQKNKNFRRKKSPKNNLNKKLKLQHV